MIMPKYGPSTDLNQKEIVDALKEAGYSVEVIGRPVDLLIGSDKGQRAINVLFEVKRPGQKVRTPAQRRFLAHWKGQVRVVESPEEALTVMRRLTMRIITDG